MAKRRRCREHARARKALLRQQRLGERVGVECLICVEEGRPFTGPFVKLGVHTASAHGVKSREYQRRYPGARMSHPELREAWLFEAEEKGFGESGRRRRRRCQRGHSLAGNNVITTNNPKWRIRACRKCVNERRRARLRERSAASGTKLCECGCGTVIPKISTKGTPQRFVHNHHLRRP